MRLPPELAAISGTWLEFSLRSSEHEWVSVPSQNRDHT